MQEPTRDAFIQRIQRFPSQVRVHQFRARVILGTVSVVFFVISSIAIVFVTLIFSRIAWYLAPTLPAALHSIIALFVFIAFSLLTDIVFRPTFKRYFRVLRDVLGAKRNPFRVLGVASVVELLHSGAPFGLYLRSFFDEEGFVPTSRAELTSALAALDVNFIAVENSRSPALTEGPLVLSVPPSQWQATVFELMELASVIVVDVNVGILHWMDELPEEMGFVAGVAEVARRGGMVHELEEVLARKLDGKTVVLAPPGWRQMMESGEIAEQIYREEEEAMKRYLRSRTARGQGVTPAEISKIEWFSRTRLKRALSPFVRVTLSVDETIRHVQEVLLQGGCDKAPRHDKAYDQLARD
jgi:hypothetical protein